ncbi:hypothetical protein AGR1A_pAt20348 [Agrobacterium fabacearum CFBP 5771]|nr:hypothetical protein AGR1A_pAt20348 [Agrobacterium fabacearum CFBP 5771]
MLFHLQRFYYRMCRVPLLFQLYRSIGQIASKGLAGKTLCARFNPCRELSPRVARVLFFEIFPGFIERSRTVLERFTHKIVLGTKMSV